MQPVVKAVGPRIRLKNQIRNRCVPILCAIHSRRLQVGEMAVIDDKRCDICNYPKPQNNPPRPPNMPPYPKNIA